MNRGQIKVFSILLMVLMAVIALKPVIASTGDPLHIEVIQVKVNGDEVTPDEVLRTQFRRGNELDITVKLQSELENATEHDVEVTAMIVGDSHHDISETSDPFDLDPGVVYTKYLTLKLPDNMEQDDYKLRILVADRYGAIKVYSYNLKIDTEEHHVIIKDVSFTPAEEVMAGRALLAVVRIKNIGEQEEDSVKIKVAIPELGISATDYIDDVEPEDSVSSEELYMRIPSCATAGTYQVEVTVKYDDDYKETTKTFTIDVVEGEVCGVTPTPGDDEPAARAKTVIMVSSETQQLTRGEGGAVYPITITNQGRYAKTYTLVVEGAEWASFRIDPSNVMIVGAGETKTAYIFVAAKDTANLGGNMFSVSVMIGDKTLEQIPLQAEVTEKEVTGFENLKRGLEIALIVLIVLLIIVGLVIGFRKMKGAEEEEEPTEIGETYY